MKFVQILVLSAIYGIANAGGSHVRVQVLQFSTYGDGEYLLVVMPRSQQESAYKDPYMGNCPVFSVIGEYEGKGFFERGYLPTREDHDKALEYLFGKESVMLGWMGQGFKALKPDDPCLVRSRALKLVETGDAVYVTSWYSGT